MGEPLEDACPSCGCGCASEPPRLGRSEALLGLALLMALAAEGVALITHDEGSLSVLGLSLLAILLGGRETLQKGLKSLSSLSLDISFLMSIAVIGAFLIGSYPEAAMVIVLFAIAGRVEAFAMDHARRAVSALMTLAPDRAFIQKNDAWVEVEAKEVQLHNVMRVRPGDRIALDGLVIRGSTSVNQAPITGESAPVVKDPGDPVYAGTINQEGLIECVVTGVSGSTTLDRIIKTVQEAQAAKAPSQRFIDSFARWYTPSIVAAAALTALVPLAFQQPFLPWLYKALVILVIACPCALVISIPVTVVSGLAAAARQGILIKGGAYLEAARSLTLIALDKTGTLTLGVPHVVKVMPLHGEDEDCLRQLAASLEFSSSHPIAQAIVQAWSGELLIARNVVSLPGRGLQGEIEGRKLVMGSRRLMQERGVACRHVDEAIERLSEEGASVVLLADETKVLGVFAAVDQLRPEAKNAVKKMKQLGLEVVILTGDRRQTAAMAAAESGIDKVEADLLPEDKLETIRSLQKEGHRVGMVGDGINDAPALASSTVGFAMGAAGSDAAIETADIALMQDDLTKVPACISLSRKCASLMNQNLVLALSIKLAFFLLALTGHATLWMAVFADMGSSLLVIGNGLRALNGSRQAS